jgi:hypothetical protein
MLRRSCCIIYQTQVRLQLTDQAFNIQAKVGIDGLMFLDSDGLRLLDFLELVKAIQKEFGNSPRNGTFFRDLLSIDASH